MHLERPGTWLHGGSVDRWVFLICHSCHQNTGAKGAFFSYLLSHLTSSCNGSSSVCPSIFWLECRSSSDTNPRCMDLLVSVISPALVVEILCHERSHRGGSCTRCIILATPKPHISLPPRHSRYVTQRASGDLGTHAQSRRQDSDVKGTWLLCLGSNDCERTEVCHSDVCWVSRCHPVACRLSKNSVVPFQRLRISPACGQVSSIIISFCCSQESDCCPLAFSEVKAKMLFVVHWVE